MYEKYTEVELITGEEDLELQLRDVMELIDKHGIRNILETIMWSITEPDEPDDHRHNVWMANWCIDTLKILFQDFIGPNVSSLDKQLESIRMEIGE